MKVCSNGPGQMDQNCCQAHMVKTLKKSSSLELNGRVCSNDDPGWVDLDLFYGKVIVYDIEVGRCRQPNKYMKLYEYQWSRSVIDFCPRSHRFNIFKLLFLGCLKPNFMWSLRGMGE